VRAVLLDNVVKRWNVPLAELSTEPSVVVHAKSGRRIGYGEIGSPVRHLQTAQKSVRFLNAEATLKSLSPAGSQDR
jgi:CO/xanthine dehydrogenase Mo-binding subunit